MEKKKLNYEALAKVSGGKWDSNTLTYPEWVRLQQLHDTWYLAPKRSAAEATAETAFFAYVAELEAKYGPSGWTEDEWLYID